MNAGKYIAAVLALAMLAGCASYPIAKNLREQAKPLTVSQVKANPEGARGSIVIWGGRIINTVNSANGGEVYIMSRPLRSNGKPVVDGPPLGRFIATSGDYVEPEAFPAGWLITVAGQVTGVRTEMLQNFRYTYPVVAIEDVHVWPVHPPEYYYGDYYGGPGWDYWWGPDWWWYGGGFYYPYYYGPHGGFHRGAWGFEGHGGSEGHGGFEGHAGVEGHGGGGGGSGVGGGGGGGGAGHSGR